MTNSTPKSSNKIERQGSPNSQGKQRRSSNYVKTVTYFSSGNNNNNNATVATNATPTSNNNNNNNNSSSSSNSSNGGAGGRNSRSSNGSANGAANGGANGRQSCSPPCSSAKNIPRSSPMRYDSPRGSPTNSFYAGAKFSEPPSPASLPKPPSHWTGLMAVDCRRELSAANGSCHISQHFNMILNIQA